MPSPRRPLVSSTGTPRATSPQLAAGRLGVVDEVGLGQHDDRLGAAVVGQHELALEPPLVRRRAHRVGDERRRRCWRPACRPRPGRPRTRPAARTPSGAPGRARRARRRRTARPSRRRRRRRRCCGPGRSPVGGSPPQDRAPAAVEARHPARRAGRAEVAATPPRTTSSQPSVAQLAASTASARDLVDEAPRQRRRGVDARAAERQRGRALAADAPGDARRAAGAGHEPEASSGSAITVSGGGDDVVGQRRDLDAGTHARRRAGARATCRRSGGRAGPGCASGG